MAADAQIRSHDAGEHLALLRSLARELERAMRAITHNDLAELEESIATQHDLSVRLTELAQNRRESATQPPSTHNVDADLQRDIHTANSELQKLNLRYSLLIEHSSRSAAQMAALFRSFRGQFQEASGARDKHALSCQG